MNLALDFGNSLTKLGIFKEGDLILFESFKKLSLSKLQSILKNYPIEGAIISSVVNEGAAIEKYLRRSFHFVKFSSGMPLPIQNLYETPGTLGMDRLAGIVGAHAIFPHKNTLVINAGTCITYDTVTAQQEYFGGNITAGLDMQLKALHTFTHRLPLVKKQFFDELTGKSTTSSILAGVIKGTILEMNGFIDSYKKIYPSLKIILTGGDAPFFETHLKSKIFALPNLVLYGINKILMNESI